MIKYSHQFWMQVGYEMGRVGNKKDWLYNRQSYKEQWPFFLCFILSFFFHFSFVFHLYFFLFFLHVSFSLLSTLRFNTHSLFSKTLSPFVHFLFILSKRIPFFISIFILFSIISISFSLFFFVSFSFICFHVLLLLLNFFSSDFSFSLFSITLPSVSTHHLSI